MAAYQHPVYLSGCAIYRNEARYLAEWLEFHRLVGFERFYLYNNASTDEHRDVLETFVRDGFVDVTDWPIHPAQIQAYDDCLKRAREETRWLAFFDIDEFCYSPLGRPVPEVLGEYEAHPGLGINIVVFGTSGHVEAPEGPVIENYVRRDNESRNLVKSIVDPTRTIGCIDPHCFRYMQCIWPQIWAEVNAVDERHRELSRAWTESTSTEKIRLNHYYFKSETEAREKFRQGKADGTGLRAAERLDYMTRSFTVEDRDIQMYLPSLREALGLDTPSVRTRV